MGHVLRVTTIDLTQTGECHHEQGDCNNNIMSDHDF